MTQTTKEQLREYADRMQEIVHRTYAIDHILRDLGKLLPLIILVEITYLQLRHILELIATALLVVNENAVRKSGNPNIKSWHAVKLLRAIEAANSGFFPVPIREGEQGEDWKIMPPIERGNVLTYQTFVTLWDKCGALLHTNNPFATKTSLRPKSNKDCEKILREAEKWQLRIIGLLTQHIFLTEEDNCFYLARILHE